MVYITIKLTINIVLLDNIIGEQFKYELKILCSTFSSQNRTSGSIPLNGTQKVIASMFLTILTLGISNGSRVKQELSEKSLHK
jgi:hypothetical protein